MLNLESMYVLKISLAFCYMNYIWIQELNIMNNSLTRLYQSHGHPSVTAAVTPVQRSDNTLAMPSPPGTAKLDDDIEKVTFPPCSPKLECKEPHIDSSQSIKEVAESMVCY